MIFAGIRELRNDLSRYVRRVEAGERIAVTARGRVVAELVPPTGGASATSPRYQALITAGIIRPAVEGGDPLADLPILHRPSGTASALIDADRGDR